MAKLHKTYLGIDVGTTATRVALVRDDGTVIVEATGEYSTQRGDHGIVEQDPESWLTALETALHEIDLSSNPPTSIGLCGQTPTVVLVDESGRPVRAAMTWQDTRASAEADELAQRFGAPEPLVGTALPWSASNMPAKLLWLARHEPDVRRRTRYVLQPKDYVGLQLSGSPLSDPWSSKGLCRVDSGAPVTVILEACGWRIDVCPPTSPAWAQRGVVNGDAAARYGLLEGTPVTVGWSDAMAEVLAAGCFANGTAFVFSGTSSIVGTALRGGTIKAPGLFTVPTSCAPTALLYGPTQSGGASLAWAARLLGCSLDGLLDLAASATDPTPPLFVPYLSGERTPLWNNDVRALFLGLGERHGPADVAAAVLLGVFLSARHVLALAEAATHDQIRRVELVGRGVGNSTWERAALDGLGLSLRVHDDADLTARGAAMLAAGIEGDLAAAARAMSGPTRTLEPAPNQRNEARQLLTRYRRASAISVDWANNDSLELGEPT